MILSSIYSGSPKDVPYASIRPPASDPEKFIANVARRCPPIEMFKSGTADVQVIGVFPEHFAEFAREQNWTFVEENGAKPTWDGTEHKLNRTTTLLTNFSQRPDMWRMRDRNNQEFLAFCTEPCQEAVCHWASMLDQLLRSHRMAYSIMAYCYIGTAHKFVNQVVSQSGVIEQLNTIKKLNNRRVILIVGYSKMAESVMQPIRSTSRTIECGPYFSLKIWEDPKGSPIVAMTVRFNFRGSIGRELVKKIGSACDLGGILFVTKVAQHISQTYQGCVFPGAYSLISPEGNLPNALITPTSLLPRWTSRAVHYSTATTLLSASLIEQALRQGGNTWGTEISFLADGAKANGISFQAICLASDDPLNYSPILSLVFKEVGELGKYIIYRQSSPRLPIAFEGVYDGDLEILPLEKVSSKSHSMGHELESYARSKGPSLEILNHFPVKVIGVAPEDVEAYATSRGWKILESSIWDGSSRVLQSYREAYLPPKSGNTQRPSLYRVMNENKKVFLLLPTMPSEELILHWGTLIKLYYPDVEAAYHSGSVEKFAQKRVNESGLLEELKKHPEWSSGESVLVMGYTKLTAQYLCSAGYKSPYSDELEYEFLDQKGGFSYCLLKKEGHRPVFFVNVDFCYWGGLSGALAASILKGGKLYGLVHVAKAGEMAGSHSLNYIYLPRSFSIIKPSGEIFPINLTSHLFSSNHQQELGLSGDHVSVSSTLIETLQVVEEAKANGGVTVDVEGAHFCKAAVDAEVKFGAVYYASDTVRADAASAEEHDAVSLVSDLVSAANHKEDRIQEGILYRLLPVLRL